MLRQSLRTVAIAITVGTVALVSHLTAQTPTVSLADYQRAVTLQARFTGKATGVTGGATWLASGKFRYRKSVPGGHTFVLVDPAARNTAAAAAARARPTAIGRCGTSSSRPLLGAKTPDWNEILPATPPGTTSGPPVPKVAGLFGPTWGDAAVAVGRGQ